MSKPSTARPAQKTEKPYDGPPSVRVRAVKTGHNEYAVVRETFADAPTLVEVLQPKTNGAGAQYWCRLELEKQLGPNRLGGTGLE